MRLPFPVFFLFIVFLGLRTHAADPPGILSHQGRIAISGTNYHGTGYFKFSLVKDAGLPGEANLWHHDGTATANAMPGGEVSVTVNKGHYSMLLGEAPMTAIDGSVFADNDNVSLRIWFKEDGGASFEHLIPDRRITSVGYAMVAKTALTIVDGTVTSAAIADGTITAADLAGDIGVWTLTGGDISFNGGDIFLGRSLQLEPTTATSGIIRSGASDTLLHTFGVSNSFFGVNAGNLSMTGGFNTSVGEGSLTNNSSGEINTAIGEQSMTQNTEGSRNVAVGRSALRTNITGNENTGVGVASLYANTTGTGNTAVGRASMVDNSEGMWNSALGSWALVHNSEGNFNVAVAHSALRENTTGIWNTALGTQGLNNNTTGSHNIGIGDNAGFNLTTGDHNIMIGNEGGAGESATIRIGDSDQTRAFIAGIRDVVPQANDSHPVVIDSDGQLGSLEGITVEMLSPDLRYMLGLYDISEGLVGWFSFDGNGDDSSGNGINGTEVGVVTYASDRFGQSNSALSGTTGVDPGNRIEGTGLSLAGNSHSISLWLRTNYIGDGTNGNWLFRVGSASSTGKSITVAIDYGQGLRYSFFFDDFDIATSVSDQNWHHVAVTFDHLTLERKIYIDGSLNSTDTAAGGFSGDDYFAFLLVENLPVDLDEFRFYNRVLPAEEVGFLFEKVR